MRKSAPLKVKKLVSEAKLPSYAHTGDAGFDLSCIESFRILPGKAVIVSTGLAFGIPNGYEIQIRSRSGLAAKHGVQVLNAPGTIDCGFTGEVKVILYNHGYEIVYFNSGDRIAQGVLQEVPYAEFEVVPELGNDTSRGTGGFGSTGV